MNSLVAVFSIFLMGGASVWGQVVEQVPPIKANCCLATAAQALADQLQDWNQLGRYAADNEAVAAGGAEAGRVVFLGDSITSKDERWRCRFLASLT